LNTTCLSNQNKFKSTLNRAPSRFQTHTSKWRRRWAHMNLIATRNCQTFLVLSKVKEMSFWPYKIRKNTFRRKSDRVTIQKQRFHTDKSVSNSSLDFRGRTLSWHTEHPKVLNTFQIMSEKN
jgi:hypothetical protein